MQQGRPEFGAMTFDEVSLERSKGFVQALQVSPAPPLNPDPSFPLLLPRLRIWWTAFLCDRFFLVVCFLFVLRVSYSGSFKYRDWVLWFVLTAGSWFQILTFVGGPDFSGTFLSLIRIDLRVNGLCFLLLPLLKRFVFFESNDKLFYSGFRIISEASLLFMEIFVRICRL